MYPAPQIKPIERVHEVPHRLHLAVFKLRVMPSYSDLVQKGSNPSRISLVSLVSSINVPGDGDVTYRAEAQL